MRKLILMTLTLTLISALLVGCAGKPAVSKPDSEKEERPESAETVDGTAVKTGLSIVAAVDGSTNASAEGDGKAETNIALVAVTVGDDGVIDDCVIDMVQTKIGFNAVGELTTDTATAFLSKNELGEAYGMKSASSVGKEWNEQAAAMAAYAVGKTVEEIKTIAVNEKGTPVEADLAASVTISVGGFISGIEDAVNKAEHLGAKAGDRLTLNTNTDISKSKSASAEEDGLAQVYTTVAAATLDGDIITSCSIDAVQADVHFGIDGVITTDLTAQQPSKNELGDDYGMKEASAIGKEWYEQAGAFAAYVTGKTVDEVAAIAVDGNARPVDVDLAASVTISVGDFRSLIAKAAE